MMKHIFLSVLSLAFVLSAKAQVTDYQNWMSQLDDQAFVCQLSVPGAHDACSSSFSGLFSSIYKSTSQTQTKTVQQMLPLGIRLFDLRPCVSGSKLHINHGIATTSFDFDPVMQQICDYVAEHPTEFCIVVIRHEVEGDNSDSKFGSMLQASLAAIKDRLVDFRPNLTVGEARGKILFISRDEYDAPLYGGRTVDLSDNRSAIGEMLGGHCYGPGSFRCSWWLQDHYEISDDAVKQQAIRDMLTRSSQLAGKYGYTWVVNQTSGYKGTSSSASKYQANAKTSNKFMQQLLASGDYNGPAGLVFMDYAGDGDNTGYFGLSLTRELINHNFRYNMSRQGDPIYQDGNLYVAPCGRDMMWEAKYLRKEGPSQPEGEDANAASQLDAVAAPTGWYAMGFNDSQWQTKRFPTASPGTGAPYYSQWDGTYNVLYIRREFYVDHDPAIDTYRFYTYHDDDYKVYLNGSLLDSQNGWSTDFSNYRVVNISSSRIRVGRNVLAVQVQQNWGGAYFDCGILRTEGTSAPLKLTSNKWHSFVAPGHSVDFSTTDVKAYKVVEVVDEEQPYAKTEEVTLVPADAAVIVRSDKGAGNYNIPVVADAPELDDNLLLGTAASLAVTTENTIYCISEVDGVSGFYPVRAGTSLAKGKCYLDLNGSMVRAERILLDPEDPTGIGSPCSTQAESRTEDTYNMAGQKVANGQTRRTRLPNGIYITGGRKVAVY